MTPACSEWPETGSETKEGCKIAQDGSGQRQDVLHHKAKPEFNPGAIVNKMYMRLCK